jgi:hypothetical protein
MVLLGPLKPASKSLAGVPPYDPAITAVNVPIVQTIHYGSPQVIKISGTAANEGSTTDSLTITLSAHYNLDFEASWIGTPGDTVQNGVFDEDFASTLSFTMADVPPSGTAEISRELTLRCPAPNFNFVMNYYLVMSAESASGMDSNPEDSSMTEYRSVTCIDPSPTPTPTSTSSVTPTLTPPAKACGDANLDGSVNAVDAQLVLQYVAALIQELDGMPSADTNGDGSVASTDALLILQYTGGLIHTKACA